MTAIAPAAGLAEAAAAFQRAARLTPEPAGGAPSPVAAFGAMLSDTRNAIGEAETQAAKTAMGKGDLVSTATAVSAAEVAMETAVAIRERALSAYNDIMRMPV
jgi:flagellar hook-basal body complex protein FliE